MSLKKIEQVREGKLFRTWDILIYALVIVVSVLLIIFFAVTRDNTQLTGIVISFKGRQAFTYDFNAGEYVVYLPENISIEEETEEKILLRVFDDDGFNDVEINLRNDSVRMVDADCSTHKDCTIMQPLTVNGSVPITCLPHGVVIRPLQFVDDGNIIT